MKFSKSTQIFMFLLLILSLAGCKPKESDTSVEEVDLSHEKKSIEAFGVIKPEESMDIIIDFNSVVKEVLVSEGQHIGLNEPILTLDLSQYEAQISDSQSELSIAQLEYEQISMDYDDLNTEFNKLKNNIELTEKLYLSAEKELNTNEKLFEEGAISEETYNQSKMNMDEVKNNLNNLNYEISNVTNSMSKKTQSKKHK